MRGRSKGGGDGGGGARRGTTPGAAGDGQVSSQKLRRLALKPYQLLKPEIEDIDFCPASLFSSCFVFSPLLEAIVQQAWLASTPATRPCGKLLAGSPAGWLTIVLKAHWIVAAHGRVVKGSPVGWTAA